MAIDSMRMRVFPSLIAGLMVGLMATGCAHEPAVREHLPASLALDGKAIAVIGDLQQTYWAARFVRRRENNADAQRQLLEDLTAHSEDIAALAIVGDLVFSARSRRHWKHFDALIAPIAGQVPVLPAIGNHDYPCFFVEFCRTSVIARGMRERFPWFAPGAPYAVDSGEVLLLFLDSETDIAAQGSWLAAQLDAAAASYSAALVFFHRPPYTDSLDRGAHGDPAVLEYLVPVFQAAALPLVVFNGHVHGLEYFVRDGVHYLTSGGGGGPRGPMGERSEFDRYSGVECRQPDDSILRPLNYLLVEPTADRLTIRVRGFCKNDPVVRELQSIEVPL